MRHTQRSISGEKMTGAGRKMAGTTASGNLKKEEELPGGAELEPHQLSEDKGTEW